MDNIALLQKWIRLSFSVIDKWITYLHNPTKTTIHKQTYEQILLIL